MIWMTLAIRRSWRRTEQSISMRSRGNGSLSSIGTQSGMSPVAGGARAVERRGPGDRRHTARHPLRARHRGEDAGARVKEVVSLFRDINGWLTELTDSLTDRTFKITRF